MSSAARESMKANIGAILDGKLAGDGAERILLSTAEENINAEQIAGAVEAVMDRSVPFPTHGDAIDVCGTGGDYLHLLNISTAAAFVVAACGVKVAKHGNRAITSSSGSADVLEALRVRTAISADKAEQVFNEVGLTFLFAPSFHPGFARLAPLRKSIGQRTILNLLGPLCNPAKVDYQLIGVYSAKLVMPVAGACNMLGRKKVMVVHGADGSDEVSITGETHYAELSNNVVTTGTMMPNRAGLRTHPIEQLKGGDAEDNAQAIKEIFDGVENAFSDAVIFNAAAALVTAEKAPAMRGGATMAREALATGEARRVLNHLIEATNARTTVAQ